MNASRPAKASVLDELKEKGYRLTAQRRVLIETIQHAAGHLDAAMLLSLARKRDPHVNRATVYRTLELLKKLGLFDRRDHVHLACLNCGAIQEFTSPLFDRLRQEIARENCFEIRVIRLEVAGHCRSCRNHAGPGRDGGDVPLTALNR